MEYCFFFMAISLFYDMASREKVIEIDIPARKPSLMTDKLMQLESNKELRVSILGTDNTFNTYMNQMIEQDEGLQGPIQFLRAAVSGNFFHNTDLDNQKKLIMSSK